MPRSITIKLSGLAESFIDEMKKEGLDEADVIAQGIGLLQEVWRTGRVGLISEVAITRDSLFGLTALEQVVSHLYRVQTPDSLRTRETSKAEQRSAKVERILSYPPSSEEASRGGGGTTPEFEDPFTRPIE